MAAVKELLRAEGDGTLVLETTRLHPRQKRIIANLQETCYKVKTFSEITKLEKNGMFVYESVPEVRWKILKRPIQK